MEINSGCVYLVGAGPGDPDLLTLKALKVIKSADVIVYDRLVSHEILDLAPAGATRISVGKQPSHHPVPQEEINDLIVRIARKGRIVVRLKGGDPLVFGRGSEEAMELVAHGVSYEVVPGITAAQGCAATCGIPLTHRGVASGVRYLTGHCRQDRELDFDWQGLADPDTTLVVYMGRANIAEISEKLIAHGMPQETPVLAVNNATTPRERRLSADLDEIPLRIEEADFEGPVLFIIGKVAALSGKLGKNDVLASNIGTAYLA
ncbi:MAG: uroporphyrinogen-III C-methyltransferase [Hyphomicrobiales bacterium]